MRLANIVCELYWVVRVRQLSPPNRGAFHFCVVRALLTPRVSFQLSLSACSDPQQAWEGPRGSLTAVLCEFLGQHIFLEYDLLCSTDKADMGHSEKPLPIISFPYVPRQVRHSPLLTPPPICLSAYLIEFSPFFSFELHDTCRALHDFTLSERKKGGKGPRFDGELVNFQAPQLSSLTRLVSVFLLAVFLPAANLV